jgi:hypothetical protein
MTYTVRMTTTTDPASVVAWEAARYAKWAVDTAYAAAKGATEVAAMAAGSDYAPLTAAAHEAASQAADAWGVATDAVIGAGLAAEIAEAAS